MGIDAPHNFADLQTKVDQLVMLQLSRERDVADSHSMKALVSTVVWLVCPILHNTPDTVKQHYSCFIVGRMHCTMNSVQSIIATIKRHLPWTPLLSLFVAKWL